MQHLDQHDYAIPEEEFVYHRQSQSIPCPPLEFQKDSLVASYKENPYLNQRTEYPQRSSESQMRNLYGTIHELPSIILRSKKHNLSRNACTQRIEACERNVLDNELSLSRNPDDASSQGNVEGAKKDSSACKVTFNEVHKMFNIEGKEVDLRGCIRCWYEVQPAKLIPEVVATTTKQRKNKSSKTNFNDKEGDNEKLISNGEPQVKSAAKYRKNKISLGKKTPTKLFMKGHETPGVTHSDPSRKSFENDPQPNEDPTITMQKLSLDIAGMKTRPECAKTTETNGNDKEGDTEKLLMLH
ncbi:hypothetical protein POM88_001415 [Heracleum sosnowskyi]|uniref:Uncharacterized protein n=1 Tax=Heracleum sosnowskyi TaxID=360622 RepID=A0AAD8JC32_9APIA|nr:hypothetical protein POM88_001415 [Heracleum sosnowskyi]